MSLHFEVIAAQSEVIGKNRLCYKNQEVSPIKDSPPILV